METSDTKLVKRLTKSLMGIIISLAVFACGFATLVLHFSKEGLETNIFVLICCLAGSSLIGLLIVFPFVAKKLMKLSEATDSTIKEAVEKIQKLLKEILEQISKTKSDQK